MITSGLISILADTLCQKVIEKKMPEHHSYTRTLRQSSVSGLYAAPVGHVWFGTLLPVIISPLKAKSARVISSVILDNTLFSAYSISTGVFLLEFLKSGDVNVAATNVKNKFLTIITNSMKFWCVVSTINHTFVPVQYKVLVGNICGIVWQAYMSYMVNGDHNNEVESTEDIPEEITTRLEMS